MSALVQPAAPTGQHLAKWGIRRSRGEAHQQQRDSRRAVAPSFYRRRVVRGATLWRSAKVVRASGGLRENDNRQACSLTARVTIFLRFFDGASQAESESPSQLQALRVCVCTSSLLLSLPTPFCSVVLNPLTFNCVLIFQPVLRFCFSVGGNSFRRLLSLSLSQCSEPRLLLAGAAGPAHRPAAMSAKRRVAYYYSPDVGHHYYGPGHPMKPMRLKCVRRRC